jgi:hypothetical protein
MYVSFGIEVCPDRLNDFVAQSLPKVFVFAVFVIAQAHKLCVSQPICGRPLQEFDLNHGLRPHPHRLNIRTVVVRRFDWGNFLRGE